MNSIQDRSATVVVVDPGSATRMMMSSVLRALGFQQTIAVANLAEAVQLLGKDRVDWLVTSLFPQDKVNALHILQLQAQHVSLSDLRVSLFVDDAEAAFLPTAFALGALSWHPRPFNKSEFSAAMDGVLMSAEQVGWNDALTAAVYIRRYHNQRAEPGKLLDFETALAAAFPEIPALLLPLAEACFQTGDDQRARSLLWQAEQRDPALAEAAETLGEAFVGETGDRQWEAVRPGTCVVVDPDASAVRAAQEALEACGAKAVHTFSDGAECWAWIQSHEAPDLIVMEWRLPKVTGPTLLQRIRALGFQAPLVVVVSSLVGKKDQPLLEEMGVTTVLPKPTKKTSYLNGVAWTVDQARRPDGAPALAARIRALLGSDRLDEATSLMQVYLTKYPSQDATRKQLEAELAFHCGDYQAARDLLLASLQLGKSSVSALNLLGKALMKLGDFAAAMKIFENANEISPSSVERLCAVAEAQCATGADEAALGTLAKAQKLDDESQAVINTTVNIGLATGNAELTGRAFDKVRPTDSVLAYVNNRAVASAKSGQFSESIALYKRALAALPPGKEGVRSVLLYNLGLAQIQSGDERGALLSLAATRDRSDPGLGPKITSLLGRLKDARTSGKPLKLNQSRDVGALLPKPEAAKYQALLGRVAAATPAPRGTAGCARIYPEPADASPLVAALLANPPRLGGSAPGKAAKQ